MSDLTMQNLSIPQRSTHIYLVGFGMQLIVKINLIDKNLL